LGKLDADIEVRVLMQNKVLEIAKDRIHVLNALALLVAPYSALMH